MGKSRKKIVMRKCFPVFLGLFLFLILSLQLSCSKEEPEQHLVLNVKPADTSLKVDETHLEQGNVFVIRSSSFSESSNGIVLTPNKSKDAPVSKLVFIQLPERPDPESQLTLVAVSVSSSEMEYNLDQADYYTLDLTAGQNLISNYGISYLDWKAGMASDSEKFPCCQ